MEEKKSVNTFFVTVVIVLIFLVSIIFAMNASNAGDYTKVLSKMERAITKGDAKLLEQISSASMEDILEGDVYEYCENKVSNIHDKCSIITGRITEVSCGITDEEIYSEKQVEKFTKFLSSNGITVNGITDIIKMDLILTVKGKAKQMEYAMNSIYIVKERGKWKIIWKIPE